MTTRSQAAIAADAKNSQAYYLLGNAYNQLTATQSDAKERQANLAKAVDAYLKAISLDPQNDAAFTNLATVYYQTGQFDEAQTRVEQALKINPRLPEALRSLQAGPRYPVQVSEPLRRLAAETDRRIAAQGGVADRAPAAGRDARGSTRG